MQQKQPLLAPVPVRRRTPEGSIYAAAHRIAKLSQHGADGEQHLACPGARHTVRVDRIADIIREELGYDLPVLSQAPYRA